MYRYEYLVAWQDVDRAGRPHFPNYFLWVSRAVDQMLIERGIRWSEVVERWDLGLPIIHAECDYLAPLSLHDKIWVELTFEEVSPKGFWTLFQMRRCEDGEVVARGRIQRRFVNRKTFRGMEAPSVIYQLFAQV